jgi:hypothetical protein
MSSTHESFVDALLRGHATVDEYDDYVDAWHGLPDTLDVPELHEYLGLSWDEYQVVARDANAFRFVAAARKTNVGIEQLMTTQAQFGLAARSSDPSAAANVIKLLRAAGKIPAEA